MPRTGPPGRRGKGKSIPSTTADFLHKREASSSSLGKNISSRGVYGVTGSHYALPAMGVLIPEVPDESNTLELSSSSNSVQTKFLFEKDMDELKTYYSSNRGGNGCKSLYMLGVMTIEHRLVDTVNTHTSATAQCVSLRNVNSPFKNAVESKFSSVAVVVSFAWKSGLDKKKCYFLVKVGRELEKSSYQNFSVKCGDDSGIVSIIPKNQDLWKEYITLEFSEFDEKASTQPELTKKHWKRVGLQEDYCDQKDEVYTWNSAVAVVCVPGQKTFKTISLREAGYCGLSSVLNLPIVTVCLTKPFDNFTELIRHSIGDIHFVTLVCLWGVAVLSCKPHFVLNKLNKKVATVILVGPPNTGKTGLGEIAVTIVGTDKHDGKAFSFSHKSEHEYGKQTLVTFSPMTVSDPPNSNSKNYAELFQHAYDGTRRQSSALTYTPRLGPIMCVNTDFLTLLQKEISWNLRVRCRVIVLEIPERINFPSDSENVYKHAQCMSYYLPQLLYIDEDQIIEATNHYEVAATAAMNSTLLDDTAMPRMASNLALFYAFGEHVAKILLPDFPFRVAVADHQLSVAIPSAIKLRSDNSVPANIKQRSDESGSNIAHSSTFTDVESFITLLIEFVLSNPTVKWYDLIHWSVTVERRICFAIRTTAFRSLTNFPFHGNQQAILAYLSSHPESGSVISRLVNFRMPRDVRSTGQKKGHALTFYVDAVAVHTSLQLAVLDEVARESNYRAGWEVAGREALKQLAEREDELSVQAARRMAATCTRAAMSDLSLTAEEHKLSTSCVEESNPPPVCDHDQTEVQFQARDPLELRFQMWYEVKGRLEFSERLRTAKLPCTETAVLTMAKEHWNELTASHRKALALYAMELSDETDILKSETNAAVMEKPKEILSSGLCQIQDPVRVTPVPDNLYSPEGQMLELAGSSDDVLFESDADFQVSEFHTDDGQSSVPSMSGLHNYKMTEQKDTPSTKSDLDVGKNASVKVGSVSRKRPRKTSKLSRSKKRKVYNCGICNTDKPEKQLAPCSLFESCKQWICEGCIRQSKPDTWLKERRTVANYHLPDSPFYFVCSKH